MIRRIPTAWLPALLSITILFRIFVSRSILDLFYNYDLEPGGLIFLKIHPATYLLVAEVFIFGFGRRTAAAFDGQRRASIALLLLTVVSVCWCLSSHNTVAVGFLVDSVLGASAFAYLCAMLPHRSRAHLLGFILLFLTADACLTLFEFVTKWRLLPYRYLSEPFFRSAALFGHPLSNGLMLSVGIPIAFSLKRPLVIDASIALFFLAAIYATGARFASAISSAAFLASFIVAISRQQFADDRRKALGALQGVICAAALPAAVLIGLWAGLGYRIAAGFDDKSAQTRVNIYAILNYIDTRSLLMGAGADSMQNYAQLLLKERVESPVVILIFLFGLPIAALFLTITLYCIFIVSRHGRHLTWIAAGSFTAIALSNDALVSKDPLLIYVFAVIAGLAALEKLALNTTQKRLLAMARKAPRAAEIAPRKLRPI